MKNLFELTQIASSKLKTLRTLALAAVMILGLGLLPAVAQDRPALPDTQRTVGDNAQGGATMRTDTSALLTRAQKTGSVFIIVGLDVPGLRANDGTLDAATRAAQRAKISAAQERVLRALQAPENVSRFSSIPAMSMRLSASDFQRLLALPGITYITENTPQAPL